MPAIVILMVVIPWTASIDSISRLADAVEVVIIIIPVSIPSVPLPLVLLPLSRPTLEVAWLWRCVVVSGYGNGHTRMMWHSQSSRHDGVRLARSRGKGLLDRVGSSHANVASPLTTGCPKSVIRQFLLVISITSAASIGLSSDSVGLQSRQYVPGCSFIHQ